jgi:casein kinase II subunit beta
MSRQLTKEEKKLAREYGGGHQFPDDDSYDSGGSLDEEEEEDGDFPWISWFCQLKGNEFFCEVDDEYIQDEFNLTGLANMVPFYDNAVDMILDLDSPGQDQLTDEQARIVESAAETLYGLIHARFITTTRGLKLMEQKYVSAEFGRCPRVNCGGQPVLPVGQSDVVRESSVKVFCPKCNDIFYPRSSRHRNLDGAFWGTTFPHLLLLTLNNGPTPPEKNMAKYVPRIFGFRVRKADDMEKQNEVAPAIPNAAGPAGRKDFEVNATASGSRTTGRPASAPGGSEARR